MSQEARVKTAFATHSSLFQFRVMPFGLCNAPAMFERLMDRVLQELRWSRCLIYLDDIISFGSTFDNALANSTLIFESTTRTSGEDPSIFATALETLAIKAFGDMGQTARLCTIRDRFITGHSSCELRRHLDSVSPETPILDIVDRCRIWESLADLDARQASKPGPDPIYPTYAVSGSDGGMDDLRVAAVTTRRFSRLAEWDLRDTDWRKGFWWCTIVCCDVHDVPLRCFGARVAAMGVVASAGGVIQVTVLSCLEGGPWERSVWLQLVSQWAGLWGPPMSARGRTIVCFGWFRILYKCPVFVGSASVNIHLFHIASVQKVPRNLCV